jgi:hypothetical protein
MSVARPRVGQGISRERRAKASGSPIWAKGNKSGFVGGERIYTFHSVPADGKASPKAMPSKNEKAALLGAAIAAKVKEILK